jgi:hypothetical protein
MNEKTNKQARKGKFVPVFNQALLHEGVWNYSFTVLDLDTKWR